MSFKQAEKPNKIWPLSSCFSLALREKKDQHHSTETLPKTHNKTRAHGSQVPLCHRDVPDVHDVLRRWRKLVFLLGSHGGCSGAKLEPSPLTFRMSNCPVSLVPACD